MAGAAFRNSALRQRDSTDVPPVFRQGGEVLSAKSSFLLETLMVRTVSFTLNGLPQRLTVDEDRKLLWVLRTDIGLTGTKFGCGKGLCGTCTVLVGNASARACQVSIGGMEGKAVRTIEGLGDAGALHPLQEAFLAHQAFQCGFCTPGMLLAAYALLQKTPNPTASDIVEHLDHNLCRCGAHARIIAAVASVATAAERR